jgi:hypothetical protein
MDRARAVAGCVTPHVSGHAAAVIEIVEIHIGLRLVSGSAPSM